MKIPKTMRAAVLEEPGRFQVRPVDVPSTDAHEVLIAVKWCGVCGTDMHIFHGNYSADKLPLIPGHEFVGNIVRLGANVTRFTVGQKVIVDMNIGCGHCYWCRRNETLNCPQMEQLGITIPGAFAEYISVPAKQVIAVRAPIEDKVLALTEPLSCVVRCARKSQFRFAQSVLVLGAGAIGNLHIQFLRTTGAAPIIAYDTNRQRANQALTTGADYSASDEKQLHKIVHECTDGRGVDLVIEAVGKKATYRLAGNMIRKGGHIAAFGLAPAGETVQLDILKTILEENSVKGSVAGMGEDMHDALAFLAHKRINTSLYTCCEYPLDDIQLAFETLPQRVEHFKTQIRVA